jgi:hypothetical protein
MSPGLAKASKLGGCLLQGTGGSAAAQWRLDELNCLGHYTMIIHISTKLLLIRIIKNYNRGSFNLAVISFVPASIHIVSLGSEYYGTRSVGTITAPDRGLVATR